MLAFAEKICRDGWISRKNIRNFWELPNTEDGILGTPSKGNVGAQNYFPVSLADTAAREKFNFYTSNSLRGESLNIKLQFSQPLSKRWYLIVISEYLVHVKFDLITGAPSFEVT